ncbi:HIT family protein [Methanolobus halotolerans]|uniref:HIT family protein n=2 Tax=Methanolobus halotolerans TaxID=2052935 RepID=A0A4E0PX98_9EURY|nr:HIT family protein [Methanolobus halotolerans]
MDCLFCKIISGEIPSHKIYEDEFVYAFLDIYPCSEGHTIILPKEHIPRYTNMEETDSASLFKAVNKVAKVVERTLNVPGLNIGINNGEVAGQSVPHVHVHIIPRRENDNGGSMHTIVETHPNTDNIGELAEVIRKAF